MTEHAPLRAWLTPGMLGWHAFATVVVAICVLAGFWQLGVYDSHQAEKREENAARPAVPLTDVWGPDTPISADLLDRKVTVTGTFADSGDQVWVSGREHAGREGYWLVSPLHVDGGEQALLVVRGWSPHAGSLPDVPSGSVHLTAVLQQGEAASTPLNSHRVIGSVRVPALLNELDYGLYSGYAISADAAPGLTTADIPEPDVSWREGMRNLAYAIQWWAFAIFGVFMWWRMGRDTVDDRVTEHMSSDGNTPVA